MPRDIHFVALIIEQIFAAIPCSIILGHELPVLMPQALKIVFPFSYVRYLKMLNLNSRNRMQELPIP
jgi:hypothetical protein